MSCIFQSRKTHLFMGKGTRFLFAVLMILSLVQVQVEANKNRRETMKILFNTYVEIGEYNKWWCEYEALRLSNSAILSNLNVQLAIQDLLKRKELQPNVLLAFKDEQWQALTAFLICVRKVGMEHGIERAKRVARSAALETIFKAIPEDSTSCQKIRAAILLYAFNKGINQFRVFQAFRLLKDDEKLDLIRYLRRDCGDRATIVILAIFKQIRNDSTMDELSALLMLVSTDVQLHCLRAEMFLSLDEDHVKVGLLNEIVKRDAKLAADLLYHDVSYGKDLLKKLTAKSKAILKTLLAQIPPEKDPGHHFAELLS